MIGQKVKSLNAILCMADQSVNIQYRSRCVLTSYKKLMPQRIRQLPRGRD
jgi:hypothetical protein